MKKSFLVLLLSLCILILFGTISIANDELDSKMKEAKAIEEQGDFYQLGLAKERIIRNIDEPGLESLTDEEVLWLLDYGNDSNEFIFFSLTGRGKAKVKSYDKKLRSFVLEYNVLLNSINETFKSFSGDNLIKTNILFDILEKGFMPALFIAAPGGSYIFGELWNWITAKRAERKKIDAFIVSLKQIKRKHNALLENAPDSIWSFVLLSYAKTKKFNAEYLKKLNQFESFIRNSSLPYKRLQFLENGLLEIKQNAINYDNKIRSIVFDLPIFTIQAYSSALIESAKGIFDDDEETMMEAGLFFAKTASLINLAVDDSVRTGWTDIAKNLKSELSKNEYEELKTKSQMVNMIWDFSDLDKAITWP